MKTMNGCRSFLRGMAVAAMAVYGLGSCPAWAQESQSADQQQAQRKPISPTVMKTFGGWAVRCYPVSTPAPCDMWEATAFKKGGQLAVSISIVYVPSRAEHLLQLVVPLGVDLAQGTKIAADDFTSDVWRFHHCDRIGCYVVVPEGNPVVDALMKESEIKVRVVQFRGKSIDLTVPLKGFAEAHASMVELAKQKTSGSVPAPADSMP